MKRYIRGGCHWIGKLLFFYGQLLDTLVEVRRIRSGEVYSPSDRNKGASKNSVTLEA
jgi:hypothetical protein